MYESVHMEDSILEWNLFDAKDSLQQILRRLIEIQSLSLKIRF